ncbi:hypothetical protein FNH22_06635 [Fulvivirga sp. M361]|uniref:hypothetical protein n=1 Tax=Fulvivirga sp. M361 TaxID=2594266 RepID=UPI00117A9A03|nr:hypothetical protein [Fulvivirga sp. M361]TRX60715.1 hypothetical protein FNH22_06635 [Fulvivirga sp. M361]
MKKLSIFLSLFGLIVLAGCSDDDEDAATFEVADLIGSYTLVSSEDSDFVMCTTDDVVTEITATQLITPATDVDTGCQIGEVSLDYEFQGGNTFATDFGDYRVISFDGKTLVWEGSLANIVLTRQTLEKQ